MTKGTSWETTEVGIGMVISGIKMDEIEAPKAESGVVEVVDKVTGSKNATKI